jgi:cell division protein FtsL
MAVAAAAEVAPRIVRPARPVRDFPRPAPRIPGPARRAPAPATRGTRALGFVRRLPDHSLTDRLVRGRAWIPVLGVLLVGIVAMQVSLLQLNASMGRAIEQGTVLQTKNGQLRAQVASLGAVSRIEGIAAGMGMVMATPSQMTFLSRHGGGIRGKAIANMTAPSSSALATTQPSSSTSAPSTTATTTAPTPSTPSTGTVATPGSGTTATGTGAVSGVPPTGAGTGAATTPVSGTPSTTGATPATPVAAAPTGAVGLPPAAGGATGATTPSSGGASYTAAGG